MMLFQVKINRTTSNLHPALIFRLILICFLVGVLIASFLNFTLIPLTLLFVVAIIGLCIFWQSGVWRLFFLGSMMIVLGMMRYQYSMPTADPTKIWFYIGQTATVRAMVNHEPDSKNNHTNIIVSATQINDQPVSGQVLISVRSYPAYHYGDELMFTSMLQAPKPIDDFAYDRYLAKEGIYVTSTLPATALIAHHAGNIFYESILRLKEYLISNINRALPEPNASLFAAIILGARQGLPQNLLDNFNTTGTTHLIAISGMNITIIVGLFMQLAQFFGIPKKITFWVMTLALVVYCLIIGYPASALRAAIMGWLLLTALYFGRLSRLSNALLFGASIMVFLNPKILRDDIGFQLSFLAVLGLLYVLPIFQVYTEKIKSYFGIKESILLTLSAQATTMPILMYNFGRISLIAPIANIVVVPTLSFLTIYGFIVILMHALLPLPNFFYWPIWLVTSFIISTVNFFAQVPWAAVIM